MAEDAHELFVEVGDGRRLEVVVSGPDEGPVVVFHTGTPSAALHHPPTTRAAAENGLRLVSYGRPGYGASTAHPGRSVADVVPDTVAVLDHLGVGEFVTMGHSGGGPHALACAALLPDRCRAAASVAGVAPFDAEGLDFLAGMGPENVEEFGLTVQGVDALTPYLEAEAETLRTIGGPEVAAALGGLVPDIDKRVLTGELADYYAASFRKSVENGIAGWRDDDLAFVRPWGFELTDITVPVSGLAGRAGPDGAVRARPVARGARAGRDRPPVRRARPPVAHRGPPPGDPGRPRGEVQDGLSSDCSTHSSTTAQRPARSAGQVERPGPATRRTPSLTPLDQQPGPLLGGPVDRVGHPAVPPGTDVLRRPAGRASATRSDMGRPRPPAMPPAIRQHRR